MDLNLRKNKAFVDVEFRLNRSETSYNLASFETCFLNENLFDLFSTCFAKSVDQDNLFNYYGPTKFRRNELLKLRACLSSIEVDLKTITTLDAFIRYIEDDAGKKSFLETLDKHFNVETEWENLCNQIIETNRELINLVSGGIRERHVLWVLGV